MEPGKVEAGKVPVDDPALEGNEEIPRDVPEAEPDEPSVGGRKDIPGPVLTLAPRAGLLVRTGEGLFDVLGWSQRV